MTESPFANYINVMECSLRAFGRRRFDPKQKISVVFVDNASVREGSTDDGGPTREYLRLLMKEVHNSHLFEGPDTGRSVALISHGTFIHTVFVDVCVYVRLYILYTVRICTVYKLSAMTTLLGIYYLFFALFCPDNITVVIVCTSTFLGRCGSGGKSSRLAVGGLPV